MLDKMLRASCSPVACAQGKTVSVGALHAAGQEAVRSSTKNGELRGRGRGTRTAEAAGGPGRRAVASPTASNSCSRVLGGEQGHGRSRSGGAAPRVRNGALVVRGAPCASRLPWKSNCLRQVPPCCRGPGGSGEGVSGRPGLGGNGDWGASGPCGSSRSHLGTSWGLRKPSRGHLGPSSRPSWAVLEATWAILASTARAWRLFARDRGLGSTGPLFPTGGQVPWERGPCGSQLVRGAEGPLENYRTRSARFACISKRCCRASAAANMARTPCILQKGAAVEFNGVLLETGRHDWTCSASAVAECHGLYMYGLFFWKSDLL